MSKGEKDAVAQYMNQNLLSYIPMQPQQVKFYFEPINPLLDISSDSSTSEEEQKKPKLRKVASDTNIYEEKRLKNKNPNNIPI